MITPAGRVWVLSLGLALAAAWPLSSMGKVFPPFPGAGWAGWLLVAGAFAAAEAWVVHLQFRREAHTISLSEIPLTVGLFFLSPWLLVIAQLAGVAPTLVLYRKQAPIKVAFNLTQMLLATVVAEVVFHAILPVGDSLGPGAWAVSVAATTAGCLVAIVCIQVAIGLTEGRLSWGRSVPVVLFSLAGTAINTSLALVGVVTTYRDPRAGALLVLPAVALYLAYRAYTRERQKTERIEFLYNSGRTLAGGGAGESAIVPLLQEARRMFRAEVAEVALWSPGGGAPQHTRTTVRGDDAVEVDRVVDGAEVEVLLEDVMAAEKGIVVNGSDESPATASFLAERGLRDAMVTPLKADNRVIGTMVIGNRLGDITTFTRDHLNLLATLATQVGAAVENSRLERVLQHQAFHDSLTNLPNRASLNQRMELALARPEGRVAVLVIDLDEFKVVNDTLGHSVGDQLLVAAAERLSAVIRTEDLAARIGGDEYAVLVESIASQDDAEATAARIIEAFRPPFALVGQQLRVTASVGIATNLAGLLDPGALMLHADVAMYAAKTADPGTFKVFEPSMQDDVAERHALREDLRVALERGDLVNFYQPLVPLDGPGVHGMEALVRWRHPERGLVAPGYFIRLAEESGLIVALGRWVLREACCQLKAWQLEFPRATHLGVSVNLSAVQLRQPGFVDDVVSILKETGLDAGSLTLEITESTFMDDARTAVARLRELRGLGIRLELDDFGTGYSSLSILRDLPLDGLKIDKSFVDVIRSAADRPPFVQAIVRLADALNLEMVGEGIEEAHQAEALRAMGCGKGQGYLFARPMEAEAMRDYLAGVLGTADLSDSAVLSLPRRRRTDHGG